VHDGSIGEPAQDLRPAFRPWSVRARSQKDLVRSPRRAAPRAIPRLPRSRLLNSTHRRRLIATRAAVDGGLVPSVGARVG
jgi:hypothetical protein